MWRRCRSIKSATAEFFSSEPAGQGKEMVDLPQGAKSQVLTLVTACPSWASFSFLWWFLSRLLSLAILLPLSNLQMALFSGAPCDVPALYSCCFTCFLLVSTHSLMLQWTCIFCWGKICVPSSDLPWASTPAVWLPTRHFHLVVPHMSQIQMPKITPSPFSLSSFIPYLRKWKERLWESAQFCTQ